MGKMWTYILKRILLMLMVCFVMIRMLPDQLPRGNGDYASAELAMRKAWGYDEPILTQYIIFLIMPMIISEFVMILSGSLIIEKYSAYPE